MSDFRNQFAIVGVGVTPPPWRGKQASRKMLQVEAARLAIEDAGLRREDIDGAIHATVGSPNPSSTWVDSYARVLGIKSNFYWTISRGGSGAHLGVLLASQALSLGLANYVVVSDGISMFSDVHGPEGRLTTGPRSYGEDLMGYSQGASAATFHAFLATRHMHEYGTTSAQFGAIAVAQRQWANLNPEAQYFDRPLTIEQHQASRFVIEPLHLPDCCLQSDIGASYVVTTAERARGLKKPPVYVMGIGAGDQGREQWWEKTNYTQLDSTFARDKAFRTAQVNLQDIDVAELYDCFTPEVLLYYEDYGWCRKGEGGAFAESGATAPGGSIPVNTYGGQLSGWYLFDFGHVIEAVRQLRGECEARQVAGAEVALTNGHGGELVRPSMCANHACMVLGNDAVLGS